MLLLVDLDGERRVVDVGFGGMTLTGTLRLELGTAQPTPLEDFRLVELYGDHAMQALVRGEWRTTYRFDLQVQHPVDYEASSWYLSTNPRSHFVTGLIAARPATDRRYALSGRELSVHHLGAPSEHRRLESADELRSTLEQDFCIDTSGIPELDKAFDGLP